MNAAEWTLEALETERQRRAEYIKRTKRCPDGGDVVVLNHPDADIPPGRMACGFQCDCFGFDPMRRLEEQI